MNVGVFTTIKVKNGLPLFWDKHEKRLVSNAQKLLLEKFTITSHDLEDYLKKNNLTDCALKIIIIKHRGKTTISFEHRMLPKSTKLYKLITFPDTRDYLKIYKTTIRNINEQAEKIAKEKGAHGALFTLDEKIVESTMCNIFSINKQGKFITPPIHAKGLNGITRQIIMKLTTAEELDINKNTNGPLVLVNALRVQKISHLNGKKLVDGEKLAHTLQELLSVQEEIYINEKLPQ
jgi:branched-subunit amino acid aminotransferase/4-amino-4-deoxychorismate lyase